MFTISRTKSISHRWACVVEMKIPPAGAARDIFREYCKAIITAYCCYQNRTRIQRFHIIEDSFERKQIPRFVETLVLKKWTEFWSREACAKAGANRLRYAPT
jgi:hypothetical protein